MQAPAIDDHVSSTLYAWYTLVAEWTPPGRGSTGICAECAASAVACTIDIAAWPHDVVHLLVTSLRSATADVEDSYREDCPGDSAAAAQVAREAVTGSLARHARDIEDVLDQCLTEKLQSYLAEQVEAGLRELRRPAAS